MLGLFAIAIFLSAALVFMVQPMVGRLVLPVFGGSPAVWNTCMLFFQTLLLAAYLYAHLLTRRLGVRTQAIVHAAVLALACLALPIALPEWALTRAADAAVHAPIAVLLGLLAVVAGVPYFAVATSGPLLQRWLSLTDHARGRDPYFLFAASNAGSLLGLLAYPLAVEPAFALSAQGLVWGGVFVLFALAVLTCSVAPRRRPAPAHTEATTDAATCRRPWHQRLAWVGLAALPSSLLLGVTQHISTDVAAIPLLWVLPLAVYLLTFIAAFAPGARIPVSKIARLWVIIALGLSAALLLEAKRPLALVILLHLLALGVGGLLCHARLAADRPATRRLTEYYLLIALGGALGGTFNAVVAPLLFDRVLEYPIAIVLTCLAITPALKPGKRPTLRAVSPAWRFVVPAVLVAYLAIIASWFASQGIIGGWLPDAALIFVPVVLVFVVSDRPAPLALSLAVVLGYGAMFDRGDMHVLQRRRSFFGVHTVVLRDVPVNGGSIRYKELRHGTTVHGTQRLDQPHEPLGYYSRVGPAGSVLTTLAPRLHRAALIGLGTGALCTYFDDDTRIDCYEIDPDVIDLATDGTFPYVPNSRAKIEFILGDGRLKLAREPRDPYDIIVLDAFSSDAIPAHLLTLEAFELYLQRLSHDGVLLVHISNQFLDLAPVIAAAADRLGLSAKISVDHRMQEDFDRGVYTSTWVLVAPGPESLAFVARDSRWDRLPGPIARPWTDAYTAVLPVIRWTEDR